MSATTEQRDQRAPEGTGARERLLDAAGALIIERQSIEISLADIAAKAGLNSALVKYYFGAKSGLLVALIEREAVHARAEMQHLLALDLPAPRKMRLHLRAIMATYRRVPYLNRLLHALVHGPDPAVRQEVYRCLVQPVIDCQRRILAEGVAAGAFRPVDYRLFYLSTMGACDQFLQTDNVLRLDRDGIDPDRFRDQYIDYVTEMVVAALTPPRAAPLAS